MSSLVLSDGRISHLTYALDEVFYKSSIEDLRKYYINHLKDENHWLLLSDYYFDDNAPNKVITFSVLPYYDDLKELLSDIRRVAPTDIKHTKNVNEDFVRLLNAIPVASFSFIFSQNKYWIWESKEEMKAWLFDYLEKIKAYIEYWRQTEPERERRLDQLSKSIRCLENLMKRDKKIRLMPPLYFVSLLGGYIASLLYREAKLSALVWLSDRDSINEICHNVVRELFQITFINITKRNAQLAFTSANSESDEWYKELTRIPDYLTGTISNYDFSKNIIPQGKFAKMAHLHLRANVQNTFLYRFIADAVRIRIQRTIIV